MNSVPHCPLPWRLSSGTSGSHGIWRRWRTARSRIRTRCGVRVWGEPRLLGPESSYGDLAITSHRVTPAVGANDGNEFFVATLDEGRCVLVTKPAVTLDGIES